VSRDGTVTGIAVHRLRATAKSVWIMAEVSTADGLVGTGEASLHFSEAEVCEALARLGHLLEGQTVRASIECLRSLQDRDLPRIAARCALDQALHDIQAQRHGLPIARLLRAEPARDIAVYANINRRTRDRSPAGFAASAQGAVDAGFEAIKIAPFDGVTPALSPAEAQPLLEAAFARIASVRAEIGPDRRLLVDCHWRLSAELLDPVVDTCAELDVYWIETPFIEDPEHVGAIREATERAHARGMRTAGGELKTAGPEFDLLISRRCYDVLMPDMKYVGGYSAFVAVSEAAAAHDILISPHNPTGPVCHAHSVQASAVVGNLLMLEMQFDETPLFTELVVGELPLPDRGRVATPSAPGLGVRLDADRLASLAAA